MINSLAKKITGILKKSNVVQSEEDIYEYGLELIISSLIGITLIMLLAVFTRHIWQGIVFLVCFIVTRLYTGGYHADSYIKCNIAFVSTFIVSLVIPKVISNNNILQFLLWFITILSFCVVACYAPVENRNKLLTEKQKECYKGISILIYSVILVIVILVETLFIGQDANEVLSRNQQFAREVCVYIKIVLVIIGMLVPIGIAKEKK